MNTFTFRLFALLCISVGLYPLIYFIIDRRFGLLSSKTTELLSSYLWNIGFYSHIIFGGLALLVGWIQFNKKFRQDNFSRHRKIGQVYMLSVLISSLGGMYIALFATGGLISTLGFISLDIIWFGTTLFSFFAIKNKNIAKHQMLITYSYAACFAAVTLRLWLPILITIYRGDFVPAYQIVSWLCWVPNIIGAYFIVRNLKLSNSTIT